MLNSGPAGLRADRAPRRWRAAIPQARTLVADRCRPAIRMPSVVGCPCHAQNLLPWNQRPASHGGERGVVAGLQLPQADARRQLANAVAVHGILEAVGLLVGIGVQVEQLRLVSGAQVDSADLLVCRLLDVVSGRPLRSRTLEVFSEVDRAQRVSICRFILFGVAGEHENLKLLGALQHELVQPAHARCVALH